jgi:hypothetical protein
VEGGAALPSNASHWPARPVREWRAVRFIGCCGSCCGVGLVERSLGVPNPHRSRRRDAQVRGFALCLVHEMRGSLPASEWVSRPGGVGYRSGGESLVVGKRQRLGRQKVAAAGAERGRRESGVGCWQRRWQVGEHAGRGWHCMILGGGPNPRCSRRRDLGRLVGCGWGVGEEPGKGLRPARG